MQEGGPGGHGAPGRLAERAGEKPYTREGAGKSSGGKRVSWIARVPIFRPRQARKPAARDASAPSARRP